VDDSSSLANPSLGIEKALTTKAPRHKGCFRKEVLILALLTLCFCAFVFWWCPTWFRLLRLCAREQCYNPTRSLPSIQIRMFPIRNTVWAVCVCLSIFSCALVVQAQSGRRQAKIEPAAPIPTPTPEPTPKPKAEAKEPDLIFLVGADRANTFSMYPYSFYDAVINGCSEVLRRNSSAKVDPTDRDLNRGEAIKKAKEDSKTYVVYLQLSGQVMSGNPNNSSYDQIELEYTVFAPGTAKIVTSGRSYQNANRKGPLIVGPTGTGGSTNAIYREQLLKRAGEEAGERILRALHLNLPKTN